MHGKFKLSLIFSLILNLIFLAIFAFAVKRLGGFHYLKYRMWGNTISAQYDHKKSLFATLVNKKGGIVFLGDSITEAAEWAELLNKSNVRNRGIPGDVTSALLKRLDQVLQLSPDKIFLMIGINDLLFIPPNEVAANYRKIVEKIKKNLPMCTLYLESVLPINQQIRNIPIQKKDILALNQNIIQIAADFDLQYINLHPLLCNEAGDLDAKYSLDGIHINGEAYQIWAKAIQPYVKE